MAKIRKQTFSLDQYLKLIKAEKSEVTRNVRECQDSGLVTWSTS